MKYEGKYKWLVEQWFMATLAAVILGILSFLLFFALAPVGLIIAQSVALRHHPHVINANIWIFNIPVMILAIYIGVNITEASGYITYLLLSEVILHFSIKERIKGLFTLAQVLSVVGFFLIYTLDLWLRNPVLYLLEVSILYTVLSSIPLLIHYELDTNKERI
jgi:hypothetical protein